MIQKLLYITLKMHLKIEKTKIAINYLNSLLVMGIQWVSWCEILENKLDAEFLYDRNPMPPPQPMFQDQREFLFTLRKNIIYLICCKCCLLFKFQSISFAPLPNIKKALFSIFLNFFSWRWEDWVLNFKFGFSSGDLVWEVIYRIQGSQKHKVRYFPEKTTTLI